MARQDDERTLLKKQAELQRTRINRLRYNEEMELEQELVREEQINNPRIPFFPLIILIFMAIISVRLFTTTTKSVRIPENALRATSMTPAPMIATPPPTPNPYAIERPATDEEVKRMLAEMNGSKDSPYPRPVGAIQSGQVLHIPAAQTPDMVRVQGVWFKKREDNIYHVNGQTIYYEDRRKDRR